MADRRPPSGWVRGRRGPDRQRMPAAVLGVCQTARSDRIGQANYRDREPARCALVATRPAWLCQTPTPTEIGNLRDAVRLLRLRYGHTSAADFGPLALKALRLAMVEEIIPSANDANSSNGKAPPRPLNPKT